MKFDSLLCFPSCAAMVRVPRAVVVLFALLVSLELRAADDGVSIDDALKAGETIYRQKCAMCHGAEGEGVAEHYGKPLAGDRTVKDLAQVITDTMPEEDP
ncbi:MAG: c-type cytochrome, partial [Planctomycetales bacterium]|nr:c-type cytochrome [Planctomycetales bacterium]